MFARNCFNNWNKKHFRLKLLRRKYTNKILNVSNSASLMDEQIHLKVKNLKKWQPITLCASLAEGKFDYLSYAHYTADANGCVDLKKQPSTGGLYEGVEPMGFLMGLSPIGQESSTRKFFKKDVTKPLQIDVTVKEGHVICHTLQDICSNGQKSFVIDTIKLNRHYMDASVKRITIKEGPLRGSLFLPAGDGPFPGVIDLYGSGGGLTEYRSALLASRGFATFSLAYFNYDDLPRTMKYDLEYFEEAVDWFSKRPQIKQSGIGVIGISMGCDYVYHMAITKKEVTAAVCINSACLFNNAILYKGGIMQPSIRPDLKTLEIKNGMINVKEYFDDINDHTSALLQVEKASQCQFLLIFGEDDKCFSTKHKKILVKRFKDHECKNYKVLSYHGAGHMIEPPYTPFSNCTYQKPFDRVIRYGGELIAHCKAQEASWAKILNHFYSILNK